MKVLITGGYGFIGSHVAEEFYKKGYEVCILDNLYTGNKNNISFQHISYILDINNCACEEIFQINYFDVVVHLAAQVGVSISYQYPVLDAKTNLFGLINMLYLSSKYNVGNFIFASSAAIYGGANFELLNENCVANPLSPYGLSKSIGEIYCQKWKEFYGLKTICLRFSNVYGDRQRKDIDGGVIAIFLDSLFNKKQIIIYGDGFQTRDFIYVKDVADAIYKCSNSSLQGIYNLSTGISTNINELIRIIKIYYSNIDIKYIRERKGDIKNSVLDNTKLRNELNWKPFYNIEDGIKEILNIKGDKEFANG